MATHAEERQSRVRREQTALENALARELKKAANLIERTMRGYCVPEPEARTALDAIEDVLEAHARR